MALAQFISFDVPTAVDSGAPLRVPQYHSKWIQIHGTFSATLQLEGRMKGTLEWLPIGVAQTTAGFLEVPQTVEELRIDVTVYASGDPAVIMGGFREAAGSG